MSNHPDHTKELPLPWHWTDEDLATELHRQLSGGHKLQNANLSTIARRQDCDDVLFGVNDVDFAIVHLTWHKETDVRWPSTRIFRSWTDVWHIILEDARDFE